MGNDDDELCQPCDMKLTKIIHCFFFFANPVTTAVATTAVATIAATDLEAPGFDHLAARGDDHFQAPGEQQFASRCNKL